MTNKELVYKFLNHYGFVKVEGEELKDGEIAPIMPFLLMDAGWILIHKNIEPIACTNTLKKHKKAMFKHYNDFMEYLFMAYNSEEIDQIIDKMDEMEATIANDMIIAQVALSKALMKDTTIDDRRIMSSVMVANVFCTLAEIGMKNMYVRKGRLSSAMYSLQAIRYSGREFTREYMRMNKIPNNTIDTKDDEGVEKTILIMERKIVKWIKGEKE